MLWFAKKVDCKRLGIVVNILNHIVHLLVDLDWKDRSENLFLHNRRIVLRIHDNRRLNMSVFNVGFASKDNLPTRRVHQLRQSIEMEFIDNLALLV